MRDKNEAFRLHCIHVEKDPKKSNSHIWTCKYCGKRYTSGATRLLQHLSKTGGQVAACKEIPNDIADEIRKSMRQAASEPRPSSPPLFYEEASNISTAHASSGGAAVGEGEESMSGSANVGGKRQRMGQSSLQQAPRHVGGSVAFLRERQRLASIEIARV